MTGTSVYALGHPGHIELMLPKTSNSQLLLWKNANCNPMNTDINGFVIWPNCYLRCYDATVEQTQKIKSGHGWCEDTMQNCFWNATLCSVVQELKILSIPQNVRWLAAIFFKVIAHDPFLISCTKENNIALLKQSS